MLLTHFALKKGLFKDGSVSNPKGKDLINFGIKIGISEKELKNFTILFLKIKKSLLIRKIIFE